MERPSKSRRLLAGAAAVACRACRKLKMRCVGADNPPCQRCLTSGRECIVVFPNRQNPNRSAYRRVSSSGYSEPSPLRPDQSQGATNASSCSDLPSVYSTSAIALLTSPTPEISKTRSETVNLRGRTRQSQPRIGDSGAQGLQTPSDNELAHMIQFFKMKILYLVPVMTPTDIEDVGSLVSRKRRLAYCLAFVAARFVPGCEHIREQLAPHVVQFLRDMTRFSSDNAEETWTNLLAFAVIYAYRQTDASSNDSPKRIYDEYLNHWTLKSAIETFALRLSLHRSFEDVKNLLRTNVPEIVTEPAYRYYIFWLWLFTMAHHHSLVTRTPPSIREDTTIRCSSDLLKNVENDSCVLRILAEVDLCILWGHAGRLEKGLGEWWCSPPEGKGFHETLSILEDADAALQVWSQRWGLVELQGRPDLGTGSPPTGASTAVDFHFRFTRFCISTFATRTVHHQSLATTGLTDGESSPSPAKISAAITLSVLKSAHIASHCCDFMLDLSPLQKDSLRYIADFGFAMISFCCLYIINAFELFGSRHAVINNYIRKVEQAAHLMVELSVGSNNCPRVYGEWILARVEALEAGSLTSVSRDARGSGLLSELHAHRHSSADSQEPVLQAENEDGGAQPQPNRVWVSGYDETSPGVGMSAFVEVDRATLPSDLTPDLFQDTMLDDTFILDPRWDFSTLPT